MFSRQAGRRGGDRSFAAALRGGSLLANCLVRDAEPCSRCFSAARDHTLAGIVHGWKSYTAKEANRLLRRTGVFWQREYYDHLVQDEAEFRRVVRYVLENPVKAGLRDWPWVSTALTP